MQYRRALDPDVFLTNWSYVDHLFIPPGATDGLHRHMGVEEIYYRPQRQRHGSRSARRPRPSIRETLFRFGSTSRTPLPLPVGMASSL